MHTYTLFVVNALPVTIPVTGFATGLSIVKGENHREATYSITYFQLILAPETFLS